MKKYLIILFALMSLTAWAAVSSMHIPPETYNPKQDLELRLEVVQGGETIERLNLQYRQIPDKNWRNSPMREDEPGIYLGLIPRSVLSGSAVQYRFEFEIKNGANEYLPDARSLMPFYSLALVNKPGTQSNAFIRLNDEERITTDEDYLLVVSFLEIVDELDPRSLRVFVGDRDVTSKAEISGGTLLYREEKPSAGIRKAYVTAKQKGKDIYSQIWITEILSGNKPRIPLNYSGSINMAANAYSSSDKDLQFGANLNDFATWGELYGKYGILQLNSNLYFSSLEESNKQPVNRYNIGLKLPVLEVIAGDYSPTLSDYTINGKNIRGLYSKLDAKYLRLYWVHGESVRKTLAKADSLGNIGGGSTFKQEAIGAKLSIGAEDGFSLNIIASRHRDLRSSLDPQYYELATGDTLNYKVNAVDAAVAAMDLRINVPEQDVLLGVEVAGSLLNKNTLPGAFTEETLEDYGIDLPISPADVADIFVINSNLEPFGISMSNVAWKIYLRSYMLNNMISVDYQEVGNSFSSLGSFAPLPDARILSISDQFHLGRYFLLSGSYNLTKDNLMGFNDTSNRFQAIQAQALLRIPRLPYLKAAFNLDGAENSQNQEMENADFQPYKSDRKMLNIGMGYNITQIPYVPTQIDISYRFGDDYHKNLHTDAADDILSENKHNGMNISMINRFKMVPLKTYFGFSNGDVKDNLIETSKKNSRIYAKAEYALFNSALTPYISLSNSSLSGDQQEQNYQNLSLGLSAYPIKNMTITADYILQNYKNKDDNSKDYDNSTFRLLLSQRF